MINAIMPAQAPGSNRCQTVSTGIGLATHPRPPSMRQITAAFALEHGIEVEALKGRHLPREISAMRQNLFARLRDMGRTYSQIGNFFALDHTTVMFGVHRSRTRHIEPPNAFAARLLRHVTTRNPRPDPDLMAHYGCETMAQWATVRAAVHGELMVEVEAIVARRAAVAIAA